MTDVAVVLVTAPDEPKAVELAKKLLDEGLIVCANLLPRTRSLYRWQGAMHDELETLMVIKTRASAFEALKQRIVALHPYTTPEVLRLDVAAGHQPYLDWVLAGVPAR